MRVERAQTNNPHKKEVGKSGRKEYLGIREKVVRKGPELLIANSDAVTK